MKINIRKSFALAMVLTCGAVEIGTIQPAMAQRAHRLDLVGQWQSNLNDHYTLRSNGTYTFTIGDSLMTNQAHSGTWSLVGGHTLRLHATRRVVLQGRRRCSVSANKTFRLDLEMPNAHTITLDGARFYRPGTG